MKENFIFESLLHYVNKYIMMQHTISQVNFDIASLESFSKSNCESLTICKIAELEKEKCNRIMKKVQKELNNLAETLKGFVGEIQNNRIYILEKYVKTMISEEEFKDLLNKNNAIINSIRAKQKNIAYNDAESVALQTSKVYAENNAKIERFQVCSEGKYYKGILEEMESLAMGKVVPDEVLTKGKVKIG